MTTKKLILHNNSQSQSQRHSPIIKFYAVNKEVIRYNTGLQQKKDNNGKYKYGDDNLYPQYLYELYKRTPSLRSIIDGIKRELLKRLQIIDSIKLSKNDLELIIYDYIIFGGFVVKKLLNNNKEIYCITHIPFERIRVKLNKDNEYSYIYSPDWTNKYSTHEEYEINDVIYVGSTVREVYPEPIWSAAVPACLIEQRTSDFHLNAINNGFQSNLLVNVNGFYNDPQKEEFEKNFNEKLCGTENGARVMFSFNEGDAKSTELSPIDIPDFNDKYNNLQEWARQVIFTAFHTSPAVFGIHTENNGFSSEEYQHNYSLYINGLILPLAEELTVHINNINAGIIGINDSSDNLIKSDIKEE